MVQIDRRGFLLAAGAATAVLPPVLARAMGIDAAVRTGTLRDVEHVVILAQENRSFDHYFGGMPGVRGFGDRFPIPLASHPLAERRTVWTQANGDKPGRPSLLAPFDLNTTQTFAHMRVQGAPHSWADAQQAWDNGQMADWPSAKGEHAMGYFNAADIPFQYAVANAFTVCDAYHCSIFGGTNPNRVFLFTGTHDPAGTHGGPVLSNSNDRLVEQGGQAEPYRWTTYMERLQAAGVSWRIYQDMADNFTDNPLAGFKTFRDSHNGLADADPRLSAEGLSTFKLEALRSDVLAGALPAVSYIVAGAKDSEHPDPSSPAQGADFTARVIEALTADPDVWAKTVLLVMYDENDGFFDHVPPPAPPSPDASGGLAGASTVRTDGKYHLIPDTSDPKADRPALMGRPYGLGPRVPMLVISPWSRGGWVNSEVFDHTSVIRFLEARFGVSEPNISPWRRAVCGDLTSAFDFKTPNDGKFVNVLPHTSEIAAKAAALPGRTTPPTPAEIQHPVQQVGVRPSRALGYRLNIDSTVTPRSIALTFKNDGTIGAVFHVYDRYRLNAPPHRYTVEPGKALTSKWRLEAGAPYDLWVLGPNGFHQHFTGGAVGSLGVSLGGDRGNLALRLHNPQGMGRVVLTSNAYSKMARRLDLSVPGQSTTVWPTSNGWYDLTVMAENIPGFTRRLAGRVETGQASISDPAMGGAALMNW